MTSHRPTTMSAQKATSMASPANMNNESTTTAPSFQQLLNNLPVKLYVAIKGLVFTAGPNLDVQVDKSYTPPSNLQVSRATRADAAVSYYTKSTFVASSDVCFDWIMTLHANHVTQIRTLHLDPPASKPRNESTSEARALEADRAVRFEKRANLMQLLYAVGSPLEPSAVKMWVCFRGDGFTSNKVLWSADFEAAQAARPERMTAKEKQDAFKLQVRERLAKEAEESSGT
ncbi:hypothetical protein Q7P37_007231 [Cladosporium fusiforme]